MASDALELAAAAARRGPIVVSTGAGISAESGVPTFRGPEGMWTVGSRLYRPEQLATHAAFVAMPEESWRWYLWRRGVCRAASPNAAHAAVAELERSRGSDVTLVTQNVDGLHRRAGSTDALEIHGNLDFARCADECSSERFALADDLWLEREAPLTDDTARRLRCPRCDGWARPHVLWFDESYDEPRYRASSALAAAAACALLITVGTSAATNLPNRMVELALSRGATLIDVNLDGGRFAELAAASGGAAIRARAGDALPALCRALA